MKLKVEILLGRESAGSVYSRNELEMLVGVYDVAKMLADDTIAFAAVLGELASGHVAASQPDHQTVLGAMGPHLSAAMKAARDAWKGIETREYKSHCCGAKTTFVSQLARGSAVRQCDRCGLLHEYN